MAYIKTLRAPFNFVPLNDKVYTPDWADKVSQDVPFSDGEDGIIEVEFENLSPLFTRDGHSKDKKTNYSAHIVDKNGNKKYFIPSTTLKGMIRSNIEIMAFSKMSQYTDRFYGYRIFDSNQSGGDEYRKNMENVRGGWLQKYDGKYELYPCVKKIQPVRINEILKIFPNYKKGRSSWQNNYSLGMYPEVPNGNEKWRLVCTGGMFSKKHEYLFSDETEDGFELSDKEAKIFLTVNEPNPEFEKYIKYLNKGHQIAVFYLMNENEEITAIGLSKMIRFPYKSNVKSIIDKQQIKKDGLDLSETIFGNANENDALKGRIQFTHAFTDAFIKDSELIQKKGVLGGPKASYYPLYLAQDGNKYHTYNNPVGISGRKKYRIHYNSEPTIPAGNGNEKTETTLKALPAKHKFVFRINFHNMRKIEIGAILSALTFHLNSDAHHNVGQAKGCGLGKLSKMHIQLKMLKYDIIDYIKAFETEMNNWCKKNNIAPWVETIQVNQLIAIAREHNNEDLSYMELKEYGFYKRNKNFKKLKETIKPIKSLID